MMHVTEQSNHHMEKNREGNVDISIPLNISYGFDINPKVKVGEVRAFPGRRRVCCRKNGQYVMCQLICVEIPLDVDIEIDSPDNSPII